MDQTISVMAKKNVAKLIDFKPTLKCTDVTVPDSVCLVIANSLTPVPKLLTLGTRYNKRVVECKFGLAILALKLNKSESFNECPYKDFEELQKDLGASFEEMQSHVEEHLVKGGYNKSKLY
jgi:galactokinase